MMRCGREANPSIPDAEDDAASPPGPFEDPGLNRYYAAVVAGDSVLANRIALGFAVRDPVVTHRADAMEAGLTRDAQLAVASRQPEAPTLHI